jgi:hypothetical protein
MDCPPPPPPPVEVPADVPRVWVPVPTVEWMAARDLHAERVTACYIELDGRHALALADVAELRWQVTQLEHERDAWRRDARGRPGWGLVVAAGAVGLAVGAVGVVVVR